MKDEIKGLIILICIGLRSKMYCFNLVGDKCIKKAQGVKFNIVRRNITYENYLNCLQEFKEKVITQQTIRYFAHNLYSLTQ